jgi:hypothetical protein
VKLGGGERALGIAAGWLRQTRMASAAVVVTESVADNEQ